MTDKDEHDGLAEQPPTEATVDRPPSPSAVRQKPTATPDAPGDPTAEPGTERAENTPEHPRTGPVPDTRAPNTTADRAEGADRTIMAPTSGTLGLPPEHPGPADGAPPRAEPTATTAPPPGTPATNPQPTNPAHPQDEPTIITAPPLDTPATNPQPAAHPQDEPTITAAPPPGTPPANPHPADPAHPQDEPTVATSPNDATTTTPPPGEPPPRPDPTDRTFVTDEPTTTTGYAEPTVIASGNEARPLGTPPPDHPGSAEPAYPDQPTSAATDADEPTVTTDNDEPTVTTGSDEPTGTGTDSGEPTVVTGSEGTGTGAGAAEATVVVGGDEVTTTGPTVGGWPTDDTNPAAPRELIWRVDPPPHVRRRHDPHGPAYYAALGAAVVLVVGVVAALAVLTVVRPDREIVGSAVPTGGLPEIQPSAPASSPTATSPAPPRGPFAELAAHPLSASTVTMAPSSCSLPTFDLADDAQARFYDAAKVCADNAWRDVLRAANIEAGAVAVVTVVGAPVTSPCGDITPTDAARQCAATVYMTPAHLRDIERNDRYPGRYLGVFLREYAKALQYTSGLVDLLAEVTTGSEEDIDTRVARQATCLAGMTSGAMAGLGAVDDNITGEIRERLTSVDAPPDAGAWLDKGFDARRPAVCDSWN